jgi:hypothetical protein
MLVTMDGNDSLKRVQRRKTAPVDPGDGTPVMGESSERKDERTVGAGYYIERETVDIWEREIVLQWIKEHGDKAVCSAFRAFYTSLLPFADYFVLAS